LVLWCIVTQFVDYCVIDSANLFVIYCVEWWCPSLWLVLFCEYCPHWRWCYSVHLLWYSDPDIWWLLGCCSHCDCPWYSGDPCPVTDNLQYWWHSDICCWYSLVLWLLSILFDLIHGIVLSAFIYSMLFILLSSIDFICLLHLHSIPLFVPHLLLCYILIYSSPICYVVVDWHIVVDSIYFHIVVILFTVWHLMLIGICSHCILIHCCCSLVRYFTTWFCCGDIIYSVLTIVPTVRYDTHLLHSVSPSFRSFDIIRYLFRWRYCDPVDTYDRFVVCCYICCCYVHSSV